MNIENLKNIIVQGQISTIMSQIETWKIYGIRTGENVSAIIQELENEIVLLRGL